MSKSVLRWFNHVYVEPSKCFKFHLMEIAIIIVSYTKIGIFSSSGKHQQQILTKRRKMLLIL